MPTATVDRELISGLRISVMRLGRRLRSERPANVLSASQLSVLSTVERHGPLTPGELAAHERVQPPSITRTVGMLEDFGYLERSPHPTDRRQALLSVTPLGGALLRETRRRRDAWLAPRVAGLTAAERELLRGVLPLLDRLATS
jgi:DNA-binding MarR family transcriptional regulator